jgi:hypothetical protein
VWLYVGTNVVFATKELAIASVKHTYQLNKGLEIRYKKDTEDTLLISVEFDTYTALRHYNEEKFVKIQVKDTVYCLSPYSDRV